MLDVIRDRRAGAAELAYGRWLAGADSGRAQRVRTYRDYYYGSHPTQLTPRMRQYLELADGIDFRLNVMPIVVDVLKERLTVVGFEAPPPLGGPDGRLRQWWQANRMDAVQKDVHLAALRDGDAFLLVDWDAERGIPRLTFELAYDGVYGMSVEYSAERRGVVERAAKRWRVAGEGGAFVRLNVYTADALYKYRSAADARFTVWEPYQEPGDAAWPLPWRDAAGAPLGVPIFHFANNAGGFDEGRSELDDLIPAQDGLNKAVLDELGGADMEGFGMITLTGDVPPDGAVMGPRRILYSPNPAARFGHIPAGDIKALSDIVERYIMRVAQMSRTPLAYFQVTGQVASAETQKANESGLVSKCADRATPFGNAWEDALRFCLRLDNTFGGGRHDLDAAIAAQWAPFEVIDRWEEARKQAEVGEAKARAFAELADRGVPRRTAALLAGYTEQEAEALEEIRYDVVTDVDL